MGDMTATIGGAVLHIGSVGLGHRRLSIIDVDHSTQPMRSASGNALICFNREILNYRKFRSLVKYTFRTGTGALSNRRRPTIPQMAAPLIEYVPARGVL